MGEATPVADPTPAGQQQVQTDTEVEDGLVIWERIRQRVDDRLGIVETHAHRLLDRDLTEPELATAGSTANALAVELGQLGIPAAAGLARHMASLLTQELDTTTAVQLASTIDDIRTLVSSAVAQQSSAVNPRGQIVLLGPDSEERDAMAWLIGSHGYTVRVGHQRLSERRLPAAVLVAAPKGFDPPTASLLEAVNESWRVPVVVLHDSADAQTRRRLAAHSTTILDFSTSPEVVVSEITKSISARRLRPQAVICGRANDAKVLLARHGFETTRAAGPDHLIEAIDDPATVVVIGAEVAKPLAIELAQLIRATPSCRRVAILWEAADVPTNLVVQAQQAGVLTVDRIDDEAIAQVRATLAVLALDRVAEDHDASRVVSWAAAQVLIDRSLVAALRSGSSVAVASIRIGETVPDDRVQRAIDTLSTEFRRADILALRDERNVVVTLQGVSHRVATNRMRKLFERLELDGADSHIGISVFPTDGRSAQELAAAADAALATSHLHGGPAVVSTTWRPASQLSADVLIVDPDPVLAAMLTSALTERGYRPESIADGRGALARLTSSDKPAPKLLLLDLDTPGLDGLSLLRRLRTARALSHMRVLLMTARSAESDLRAALDLGVADVIRKPFFTTLLLHRIARLLEDAR